MTDNYEMELTKGVTLSIYDKNGKLITVIETKEKGITNVKIDNSYRIGCETLGTPIIDMSGSNSNLGLRDYNAT